MNSPRVATGLVVGSVGGAVIWTLGLASLLTGVALGGLYGLLFALLLMRRVAGPGAGLLWGLGYALLLWLAGPVGLLPLLGEASLGGGASGASTMGMLDTVRAHFPELVAYLLCLGLPLGLAMGVWAARGVRHRGRHASVCRGRWWSAGLWVS